MILGRVVGQAVSTHKRPQFEGAKLLLVQPETPDGARRGRDAAGGGLGGRRGERARAGGDRRARGRRGPRAEGLAPVDAAIIGIVDQVDVTG